MNTSFKATTKLVQTNIFVVMFLLYFQHVLCLVVQSTHYKYLLKGNLLVDFFTIIILRIFD